MNLLVVIVELSNFWCNLPNLPSFQAILCIKYLPVNYRHWIHINKFSYMYIYIHQCSSNFTQYMLSYSSVWLLCFNKPKRFWVCLDHLQNSICPPIIYKKMKTAEEEGSVYLPYTSRNFEVCKVRYLFGHVIFLLLPLLYNNKTTVIGEHFLYKLLCYDRVISLQIHYSWTNHLTLLILYI